MSSLLEPLSKTEERILRGICQGLANKDIAEKRCVSLHTVKFQIKAIYGKLGIESSPGKGHQSREKLREWGISNGYGEVSACQ